MTQAELDALPEVGTFGQQIIIGPDGRERRQVVLIDDVVLYNPTDSEPVTVTDAKGQRWRIGYSHDGVRCKRRANWPVD